MTESKLRTDRNGAEVPQPAAGTAGAESCTVRAISESADRVDVPSSAPSALHFGAGPSVPPPTPAPGNAHTALAVAPAETPDTTGGNATAASAAKKKRRRIPRWSDLSYTTRVTLAFAAIAAMTTIIAIGVLSFVWERHFQTYTRENMESTAQSTAARIAEKYSETGEWTPEVTATAAYVSVTYPGIGIAVIDRYGTVRYDSTIAQAEREEHGGAPGNPDGNPDDASGTDAKPGSSLGGKERSTSGTSQSSLVPTEASQMATASIDTRQGNIGIVRVWVYGSETLLRQTDREFRSNSYQAMVLAAIFAIVLACCIGFLFARNLVRPINRMTKTARAIKEGDLSARTGLTGDDEIARLGETFDEMADSVEKDRELERRLTTDVAHELRTPLMAIQSTVEAMVDGVLEADEEHLETVNSEVQRLSRLVNAILKLSRIENRSTPMKEEKVDVGEIVEGIIATHEAFVVDSGLELKHDIEQGVYVLGDADMIRQATANLISNAVRYTPEGGTITLHVRRGELMASIVVEDTGIGLSPEEAKMVFSRFWRADSGRTRESGGLGIGLSVVKEIVDRHHGWVQVEGQTGVGARFTIHIPLYESRLTQQRTKGKKKDEKVSRKSSKAPKVPKTKPPKVPKQPKAKQPKAPGP